jgi:hypothetical protein
VERVLVTHLLQHLLPLVTFATPDLFLANKLILVEHLSVIVRLFVESPLTILLSSL